MNGFKEIAERSFWDDKAKAYIKIEEEARKSSRDQSDDD
jgi:hypothetical protein